MGLVTICIRVKSRLPLSDDVQKTGAWIAGSFVSWYPGHQEWMGKSAMASSTLKYFHTAAQKSELDMLCAERLNLAPRVFLAGEEMPQRRHTIIDMTVLPRVVKSQMTAGVTRIDKIDFAVLRAALIAAPEIYFTKQVDAR